MNEENKKDTQNSAEANTLDAEISAFFDAIKVDHAMVAIILEDGQPIVAQKGGKMETAQLAKLAYLQLKDLFLSSIGLGND